MKRILSLVLIAALIVSINPLSPSTAKALSFEREDQLTNYYKNSVLNDGASYSLKCVHTKLWTRYGYKKVFITIQSMGQAYWTDVYYKQNKRYKVLYSWTGVAPLIHKSGKYIILISYDAKCMSFLKFTGTTYQSQDFYEYWEDSVTGHWRVNEYLKKNHFPGKEKDYRTPKGKTVISNY